MKRVDCFGKEIHVGDKVIWTDHRDSLNITGEILDFTPTRVKIKYKIWSGSNITHTTFVSCSNLIKMSETKKTVRNPNKPGQNLKEGDRVVAMYLGWGRQYPKMITGTVKRVGQLVSVYSEDLHWKGRIEQGTGKHYTILNPSRVCKID